MANQEIAFRVAMRPGKHRVLPATADGRLLDLLDLIEEALAGTASACSTHIRAK